MQCHCKRVGLYPYYVGSRTLPSSVPPCLFCNNFVHISSLCYRRFLLPPPFFPCPHSALSIFLMRLLRKCRWDAGQAPRTGKHPNTPPSLQIFAYIWLCVYPITKIDNGGQSHESSLVSPSIRPSHQQQTRVLGYIPDLGCTPASIGRNVPYRLLKRDTHTDCYDARIESKDLAGV